MCTEKAYFTTVLLFAGFGLSRLNQYLSNVKPSLEMSVQYLQVTANAKYNYFEIKLFFWVTTADGFDMKTVRWISSMKWKPGAHFTNNFAITIQMWWKFHFALIQVLIKWSLQNLAHGTTAWLSWHVPNFVAIWSIVIESELNEFSIEFELWWKNR